MGIAVGAFRNRPVETRHVRLAAIAPAHRWSRRRHTASLPGKEIHMRAVLLAASLCSIAATASAQTARPDPGPLTIARQGSFFAGGRDVKSDTLSTLPNYV